MGLCRTTLAASATGVLVLSAALSASAQTETVEAVAESSDSSATVVVDEVINYVGVLESWRARARAEGFAVVEEALLSQAALSGEASATTDVAYFYFATGLFPEASAVIRTLDAASRTPDVSLLDAIVAIKMGRWREAVELLSQPPLNDHADVAPWRGIAYMALGAFHAAANEIVHKEPATVPFEEHATQYYLARARVALEIGHVDTARKALEDIRNRLETQRQRDERRLLEARAMLARGETNVALNLMQNLSHAGATPVSLHARLDLLRYRQRTGAVSKADAFEQLNVVSMRWSGGAVERERLQMEAALHDMSGDLIDAVAARRKLLIRFPESDAARGAEGYIRTALPAILSDSKLSPREAARVFYENINLAPPGAEGDTLIRDAATVLAGMDLLPEAAELLHHQVFRRLRGAERSAVAADLAALYLASGNPEAAIDAIENTRQTRLPEAIVARRGYLEADAYFRRGETDRALAIISDQQDFAALLLRGRILSARGEHSTAGAAFADAASIGEGALPAEQAEAAVRAASVYAQIGDGEALRALAGNLGERMTDGSAKDLFDAIVADELPGAPNDFQARYVAFFSG